MRPSVLVVRLWAEHGPGYTNDVIRLRMHESWEEICHRFTRELNQWQVDALTSLYMDVVYHRAGSLKQFDQVVKLMNSGFMQVATAEFSKFCGAPGLIDHRAAKRRMHEQQWMLGRTIDVRTAGGDRNEARGRRGSSRCLGPRVLGLG